MNRTEKIKAIQSTLGVTADGLWGPKSQQAMFELVSPQVEAGTTVELKGDGTWAFTAFIEGTDIVLRNVRATCFGGDDDPDDSGETASGIKTKGKPNLLGCALPMDGRQFGLSPAEHRALDGSPIPRLPWGTQVEVTARGTVVPVPVIDLGPGKRTKTAIDLTIAAARFFDPKATARNFEMRCDVRIINGAKIARLV